jgi:membrane associated rhomboid family serine protease
MLGIGITPIVRNLLFINIAVLLIQSIADTPMVHLFGLRYLHSSEFEAYQFLTYMFVHSDFWHLFSNMFALFMFGSLLEQSLSSRRFLIFYMICGLGAGVLYELINYIEVMPLQNSAEAFLLNPIPEMLLPYLNELKSFERLSPQGFELLYKDFPANPTDPQLLAYTKDFVVNSYTRVANTPMVGASGATFGILMGFGLLFPNMEMYMMFIPIPIKAKYVVTGYGAYEIWASFANNIGDNVAHLAHVGGMLFGVILIRMWTRTK